ncbi:MAG: hypothetical protein IVW56_09525 [Candidatus Binataceae bacterium]|nr:hypothetical protein [Candidatus Binataceae bacterium]
MADWIVWSEEHEAWLGPNHQGYRGSIVAAGRYDEDIAKRIERNANYRAALPQAVAMPDPLPRLTL